MNTSPQQAPRPTGGRGFLVALRGTALALVAVLAVACAGPAPSQTVGAATPTLTAQPSSYPRAVADDEGTVVTLLARPERIVSLTPATTEIVFALGAGDRLVGRGDFDDYPPEATQLPGVATFTGVEHEALVDLEPDLVIAGGNNFTSAADIERMRDLDIPVIVVYAPTFEGVLRDIQLIGRAIDAARESDSLVAQMGARMLEVQTAVAQLDRPRVFLQLGSEPEIYGPAPGSFVADMVAQAGGAPLTTADATTFTMPVERLVELDPEVIVLGDAQYGVCPTDVAARPGWGSMTAVREGAIRPVFDTIVTRPGPRLAEGLVALALAIHPDADIAPPADDRRFCTTITLP